MAFRRTPATQTTSSPSYNPYSNAAAHPPLPPLSASPLQQQHSLAQPQDDSPQSSSPTMRKRQRTLDMHSANSVSTPTDPNQQQPPPPGSAQPPVTDDAFINDRDAVESAGDDEDEDDKPKSDKKAGRRKIKIEFIQDKSRRHITFSKRKAGIMKKAYELSTLTGTQVLLLVVSETGLVYTFTTAKLQPLVTQPEGKNLIQACLNAPPGSLPSSMPVGTPIGRSSGPMSMSGPTNNLPGGLSISGAAPSKDEDGDGDEDDAHDTRKKRQRRGSTATSNVNARSGAGATSPHSPNASIPPPLSIPPPSQHPSQQQQQPPQPQISLGSPTSPQQSHQQVPPSPQYASPTSYGHHPSQQHPHHGQQSPTDAGMYSMMPPGGPYSYPGPGGQGGQQLGGLAAAAAQQQHGHWPPNPPQQGVGQGGHYGRR